MNWCRQVLGILRRGSQHCGERQQPHDPEPADVGGAEIDVLVADDEPADLFVPDHDRVGQAGTRTGARQPTLGEQEVGERRANDLRPGRLIVERNLLVDGLDVTGGADADTGIRRITAERAGCGGTLTVIQAGVRGE